MTLNELERLISNLLRVGVVEEVDTEKMVCRVRTGDILTDWIRWGADRAGAGAHGGHRLPVSRFCSAL